MYLTFYEKGAALTVYVVIALPDHPAERKQPLRMH